MLFVLCNCLSLIVYLSHSLFSWRWANSPWSEQTNPNRPSTSNCHDSTQASKSKTDNSAILFVYLLIFFGCEAIGAFRCITRILSLSQSGILLMLLRLESHLSPLVVANDSDPCSYKTTAQTKDFEFFYKYVMNDCLIMRSLLLPVLWKA